MGSLWALPGRGLISIFTLHRFAVPELGQDGHDLKALRAGLEELRRKRYPILSLAEATQVLEEGTTRLRHAAVFTVDDGYIDLQTGAEAFLAYDAPLTVFVTTGFVQGTTWMWWDQIAHVLGETRSREIVLDLSGQAWKLTVGDTAARRELARRLSIWCTAVPEDEKWRIIAALSEAAEVPIPAMPPARFAPLDWYGIRRLEAQGVDFGPHTLTHPVLIRTSDEQSRREIVQSWQVLKQETKRPLPVFSFPNGDFGEREIRSVAELGLQAAVSTRPNYAGVRAFRDRSSLYSLPRFPYPEEPEPLCLTVSGFSRISTLIRRCLRLTTAYNASLPQLPGTPS